MSQTKTAIEKLKDKKYSAGFYTDIESEKTKAGIDESVIKFISQKKNEPVEMLKARLDAYQQWLKMDEPHWCSFKYEPIDYQSLHYYVAPKNIKGNHDKLEDVDPKILETYKKLGISLEEQKMLAGVVAVDAVFDSTSVGTTYKKQLAEQGIIFCSMQEAVRDHYKLVKKYMGTVVPTTDNFYAALNSAVFSDGTFVYIPKNTKCPIELGSYFRINAKNAGQFERTLIIAEEGSELSYLEGCSAPQHDSMQLHAAIVEIIVKDNAKVKYSTVQNWFGGDSNGKGGIYNFVTKRGIVGKNASLSWTQLEVGSALTWKYPSCILMGDNSYGEFYSVALTNHKQSTDTGTKMIHIGKNTKSNIVSKSIALGQSENSFRSLVKFTPNAKDCRNYTRCDTLISGKDALGHTYPVIENHSRTNVIEHEASTSKISEDQLFFLMSRGLDEEQATGLIINGFADDVIKKLPNEFAMEAKQLINIKIEE